MDLLFEKMRVLFDQLTSLGTIINLIVIFLLIILITLRSKKLSGILLFFRKKGILLAFFLAFAASLGSLIYSEYFLLIPCDLCWYQRIFIYPQALILLIALIKKLKDSFYYLIPFSIGSILISGYHYITQLGAVSSVCVQGVVDCTARYFTYLGFITMPFMSLVVSITILLLVLITHKKFK